MPADDWLAIKVASLLNLAEKTTPRHPNSPQPAVQISARANALVIRGWNQRSDAR